MNNVITSQIKTKIYNIRGLNVLVDRDLASIYGIETKRLLEQVRRNIERFPERYVFQMNENEFRKWKSQFATSNSDKMGLRRPPYCFTEQGSYMVANIIKNKKAIKTSIAIMDAFVEMKNYFISNNLIEQKYINNLVLEHDDKINELFSELEPKFNNKIFFKGETYDSYSLLLDIINSSKKEIIIIDNFADKKIFDLTCKTDNKVIIISKNINKEIIKKYQSQYSNLTLIESNEFHDRFIIIDKKILYHLGASLKDLGKGCFSINKITDKEYINLLLNKIKKMNYNNSSSRTSSGSSS